MKYRILALPVVLAVSAASISGCSLSGAQTPESFKQVIDQELGAKG